MWLWAIFSTVLLFIMEFVLFAAFIPTAWADYVARFEHQSLYAWHLDATATAIIERGQAWYAALFVHTGIAPWTYELFAPRDDIQPGLGFERMAHLPLWDWLRGRLDVIWGAVALALQRLALLTAWWPFFLLAVLGAIADGLVRRRIRAHGFHHSSPLAHRIGMGGLLILSIGVLVLLLAPLPLPAVGVPVLALLTAFLSGLAASQTQSRV
ncbi:MAG: DUF4400 domain-containing protein [Chromatiaceae bacterium]|nr:MAG: DUF4400 domain-containing protein [Chromatiaceae bacterium]